MAMFLLPSMKRKDSEIALDYQPDFSPFSQTKKIKISMDGEQPLILQEELPMTPPMSETQMQKELMMYNPTKGLPSEDPDHQMSVMVDMIIDPKLAGSSDLTIHTRQESIEEPTEEQSMDVEDETGSEGIQQAEQEEYWMPAQIHQSMSAPMIWTGFF